jgi:peptidyl-prolyl cis-trans isomerase SurA
MVKGLEIMPNKAKSRWLSLGFAAIVLGSLALPGTIERAVAADQIAAIVNTVPITSGDVQHRIAFLRLRRLPATAAKAREELINEQLEREEIIRTQMSVSTDDVDAAVARFAAGNKMSPAQLTQILSKAGVGVDHFKAYVGIQMSWPRVVQARYGGNQMDVQDFITRLKQNNGQKPKTTEYILQQMIFVVPESKRNKIMGKRKAEAEASRKKYPGCANAITFAATMRDVSVHNLGRILEPQLPDIWKPLVDKTPEGGTTATKVTDKGVEYLAVCQKRDVSDDFSAQIAYQADDLQKAEKAGQDPNAVKYLEELRKKAQIDLH